ncbi:FKBP-type peptidyl-prolyl cis-trans isomerase [Saccharomonospora azurea]|uniref:Peptidyl-prolyl cis-trans isomerase n=1 Tax=Saccharomonospora azurea NA-128 TaxID=882081 RepID=H8G4A4_9PSEU|nr:FKBP-type peptidyl-prolyl cis-trans isomerase [Saccharomonospora azurea]EHK85336.1 FKBP-type peptidyl-prolyl cis-trans isomerase [Saccharomonospora azurea SZMC 14600]EHY87075.1 FKBP-type peptidyl-prolyl cis-trans isomerase [Saccharomonospora azurea NA-128]
MRNAGKIITVAAVAAALAACSPPNEQPSDLPPGAEPTPSEQAAQPTQGTQQPPTQGEQDGQKETCTAEDVKATQSSEGEGYQVTIPKDCAEPTELLTRDLKPGSGPEAAEGDELDLDYTIVGWSDGEVKENSFGTLGTLSVQLGEEQAGFEGWNEALQGARQGTQRLIVVPETMGFAQDGDNPLNGETLVVVAEVVDIAPQQ